MTIVYSIFNDVDPSHIILFDCCMLYCGGCCPVAAVGRQRPPRPIDATIHMVEESSPLAPFPHPSSPTAATHRAKRCSLRAYAAQQSIQRGGKSSPIPGTYLYVFLRRKHETHTTIMTTMSPMAPAPMWITSQAVEIYITPVCMRSTSPLSTDVSTRRWCADHFRY
jgi:hypothetical protein